MANPHDKRDQANTTNKPAKLSAADAAAARSAKDAKLQAEAAKTRAEQPLPVDIFPKDAPTEVTIEKMWGGGEHRKAALKALANSTEKAKLRKAFPEDANLIEETIATVKREPREEKA